MNKSPYADRLKRIESWAESISSISEVWAFSPIHAAEAAFENGFENDLDLMILLSDQPTEQDLDQRIRFWSTILSAALRVQVHLHVMGEPTASNDALKAQLLQGTIFRRSSSSPKNVFGRRS